MFARLFVSLSGRKEIPMANEDKTQSQLDARCQQMLTERNAVLANARKAQVELSMARQQLVEIDQKIVKAGLSCGNLACW
jgi:hypothetical protein